MQKSCRKNNIFLKILDFDRIWKSESVPKMMRVGVKYLERISRTELTGALLDYWICVQDRVTLQIFIRARILIISRIILLEWGDGELFFVEFKWSDRRRRQSGNREFKNPID